MPTRTKPARVVRQKAKGPIDPQLGTKLRELRLQRGLTQADLAGTEFTKGFISLLETGRTRASLRAAGILAQRLSVGVTDLLASSANGDRGAELMVLRGEQHIAAGQPAEALELIRRAESQSTGSLRARALRAQGRALLDLGHARKALKILEEATVAFETLGQRELAVRTLYDRAVAHAQLDEPGNALSVALECESVMRTRGLVDRTLELQLRSLLAAIFSRMGDNESADSQAQRALALADDVVDDAALGTLYSTLSLTRQREGDLDTALTYARKSRDLFGRVHREHSVGQLWHNLGAIYLARREYAKSEDALGRAEHIAHERKIGSLEARVISVRAELALAKNRLQQADQFARAAIAHPAASATTRGRAYLTLARTAVQRRTPISGVRAHLDAAVGAFAGEPPRVRAQAHDAYASILARRGYWKEAYAQARKTLELQVRAFE